MTTTSPRLVASPQAAAALAEKFRKAGMPATVKAAPPAAAAKAAPPVQQKPAPTPAPAPAATPEPKPEKSREMRGGSPAPVRVPRAVGRWLDKRVIVHLRSGPTVSGVLRELEGFGVWVSLSDAEIVSLHARRPVGDIHLSAASVGHIHLDTDATDAPAA